MKFIELHGLDGTFWVNPQHIILVLRVKIPGQVRSAICLGWQSDGSPISQTLTETVEEVLNMMATIHVGLN